MNNSPEDESDRQAAEHAQGLGALLRVIDARPSHLWALDGGPRDAHFVLPIRHVSDGAEGHPVHREMVIFAEDLANDEDREAQAWGWYAAVRDANGRQGVRTPAGVLFRANLKDGAAVLRYLRRKFGLERGQEFRPFRVPGEPREAMPRQDAGAVYEILARGETFRAVRAILRRLKGNGDAVKRQRTALLLVARGYTVEQIEQLIPKGRSAYIAAMRKLRAGDADERLKALR